MWPTTAALPRKDGSYAHETQRKNFSRTPGVPRCGTSLSDARFHRLAQRSTGSETGLIGVRQSRASDAA